jgi:hypothetical protein
VLRALILTVCLAISAVACEHSEPTLEYRYNLEGSGTGIEVTYVTEAGLAHETVELPWVSEEFAGSRASPFSIEATGPAGSTVSCFVRYRRVGRTYGGNGSGEQSQRATGQGEAATHCALGPGTLSDLVPTT